MSLWEFVKKYYIDSIVYKQGYNIVNTLTWAAILLVAAWLIYRYLSKRLFFDKKFMLYTIPFIFFGSSVRVVEDAGFIQPPISYIFMTPMIYILVFSLTFPTLLIALKMRNLKIYLYTGLILAAIPLLILLSNLQIENWWVFPASISLALVFTLIFSALSKNDESRIAFFSQMLDGSASFMGLQFLGYWELHVLPRFLISLTGPWIMIPLKFVIFLLILLYLDKAEEEENLKGFIKFVIMVLGLAPGVRNALRMTFGV